MSWPPAIDTAEITEVYSVANTPAYLYKGLKRCAAVRKLASTLDAADLASLQAQIMSSPDRSVSDVAQAYAAIVAMTLRDYTEWRPILDKLDLTRLDWGVRLREIASAQVIPTQTISLKGNLSPQSVSGGVSSTNATSVTHRPSIVIASR